MTNIFVGVDIDSSFKVLSPQKFTSWLSDCKLLTQENLAIFRYQFIVDPDADPSVYRNEYADCTSRVNPRFLLVADYEEFLSECSVLDSSPTPSKPYVYFVFFVLTIS